MKNLEYLYIKQQIENKEKKERLQTLNLIYPILIMVFCMLYFITENEIGQEIIIICSIGSIMNIHRLLTPIGKHSIMRLNKLYHQGIEAEKAIEQFDLLPKK